MSSKLNDNESLRQLLLADESGFSELYRRYFPSVARVCMLTTVQWTLAEEAAMDTLQIIWQKRHEVAIMTNPKSWLYATARHRAMNTYRNHHAKSKHQLSLDESLELVSEDADSGRLLELKEIREAVDAALHSLTQQQERVMRLKLDGWPVKEIAQEFGLSVSTVRNHLLKGSQRLRIILERQGKRNID